MGKSLSVMLLFVIYCLLNIYEGILMSVLPMAAHCQHACKHFALYTQLYCSTTYKTFLTTQYWHCMPRKTSLKLVHYCILLSMACHFDARIIVTYRVTFCNKTGCQIGWLHVRIIPANYPFNSLGGRHTHTNMYTNFLNKNNFKKPCRYADWKNPLLRSRSIFCIIQW